MLFCKIAGTIKSIAAEAAPTKIIRKDKSPVGAASAAMLFRQSANRNTTLDDHSRPLMRP